MKQLNKFYINGNWVTPSNNESMDIINPATEQSVGQVSLGTSIDVDIAVKAATEAFKSWSITDREERLAYQNRREIRQRRCLYRCRQ